MIIGKDKVILSLCTTVSQFLHSNSEDEQLRQNLTEGSPDVRQEAGSPPSPCSSGFAPGSATPLGVDGRECCPPALGGGAWLCKQGRACWRAHVCSTVLPTPQTSSQRKRRTRWEGRAITAMVPVGTDPAHPSGALSLATRCSLLLSCAGAEGSGSVVPPPLCGDSEGCAEAGTALARQASPGHPLAVHRLVVRAR